MRITAIAAGLLAVLLGPAHAVGEPIQVAKLTASDAAEEDLFGRCVAFDDDTIVIGAYRDDDRGTDSGSAYVFVRNGETWTQQAKLTASDGAPYDWFGSSTALDGDTAVVGSIYDSDNGWASGSAYVFVRTGETWTQQAKLIASDAAENDYFGWTVAIDGDTIIIGADGNDGYAGSAYVFTRSSATWTQQAKLTASDPAGEDHFGWVVALDGDTTVIGAYGDDDNGSNSGSAYIFTRSGETWTQRTKLTASDGATGDRFGHAVALDDGTTVIGAWADNGVGADSGSAYIFVGSGASWTQQAKLTASDAAAADYFGWAVAIDGDAVVIGADHDDHSGWPDTGSAYVFLRTDGTWTQQAKLIASDAWEADLFGRSVAIDGDTAIIAAYFDDDHGLFSGSAYVFTDLGVPDPCVGDLNGDGQRDQSDLGILLSHYELDDGGDLDSDGDTDQADLGILLSVYDVPCP
ncbi:MAG: FG-GAP repeat protein [Phycisphaerales bacterium]|nr:FG-GAP repeat protein [Phycisphaerales bacterium]